MNRKLIIAALARTAVIAAAVSVNDSVTHNLAHAARQGVARGTVDLGLDATPTEVEDAVREALKAYTTGAL